MEPQAMIRQLRDTNRDDKDLVRLCNETILIFRNLKKEEAWGGTSGGSEPPETGVRFDGETWRHG